MSDSLPEDDGDGDDDGDADGERQAVRVSQITNRLLPERPKERQSEGMNEKRGTRGWVSIRAHRHRRIERR